VATLVKVDHVVDVEQSVMAAQTVRHGSYNGCTTLRPLLNVTYQWVPIGPMLAEAAFESERKNRYISTVLQV
jgi:hypothetical protein